MSKVWFITGCSTGFGRVFAETLLKIPVKLVATARQPQSLEALYRLSDKHPEAELLTLQLDITNSENIRNAVSAAEERFKRIDVLVNNAGYGMVGALEESNMAHIRSLFDTNVFGLIEMTQAVLPIMRKQRGGHIINMSSVAGVMSTPGLGIYNATKYAVEGLSEALALEVAELGIKVTLIEPGPFRTDFAGRSVDNMTELDDYRATVGPTRQYMDHMNGAQPGDPYKAAQILL